VAIINLGLSGRETNQLRLENPERYLVRS